MITIWNKIRWILTGIAALCAGIVGLAIVAQVFSRFFFGVALTWSEEVAELCLILTVFLALAEVESNNEHLCLEILYTTWPKLYFPLMMIGKMLTLVYCVFVMYSVYLMQPAVRLTRAKASGFPIKFIYFAMFIGAAAWLIQTLIQMGILIKNKRGEKA